MVPEDVTHVGGRCNVDFLRRDQLDVAALRPDPNPKTASRMLAFKISDRSS